MEGEERREERWEEEVMANIPKYMLYVNLV